MWAMTAELPYAIKERLRTPADLANVVESPVSRRLILLASRGDAATLRFLDHRPGSSATAT